MVNSGGKNGKQINPLPMLRHPRKISGGKSFSRYQRRSPSKKIRKAILLMVLSTPVDGSIREHGI
jgi:hypothetical protein